MTTLLYCFHVLSRVLAPLFDPNPTNQIRGNLMFSVSIQTRHGMFVDLSQCTMRMLPFFLCGVPCGKTFEAIQMITAVVLYGIEGPAVILP